MFENWEVGMGAIGVIVIILSFVLYFIFCSGKIWFGTGEGIRNAKFSSWIWCLIASTAIVGIITLILKKILEVMAVAILFIIKIALFIILAIVIITAIFYAITFIKEIKSRHKKGTTISNQEIEGIVCAVCGHVFVEGSFCPQCGAKAEIKEGKTDNIDKNSDADNKKISFISQASSKQLYIYILGTVLIAIGCLWLMTRVTQIGKVSTNDETTTTDTSFDYSIYESEFLDESEIEDNSDEKIDDNVQASDWDEINQANVDATDSILSMANYYVGLPVEDRVVLTYLGTDDNGMLIFDFSYDGQPQDNIYCEATYAGYQINRIGELTLDEWAENYFRVVSEYVLEESDIRYIDMMELEGFSAEQCRIARNEIYARHGRIFKAEDLQMHFNSCSWYEPLYDEVPEDWLNDYEIANVKTIKEYEDAMGYQ